MRNVDDIVIKFKEKHSGEVYDDLPPILRVLLSTDGTVTDILRAYYNAPVDVRKLTHPVLKNNARTVVLTHGRSGFGLLYAVTTFGTSKEFAPTIKLLHDTDKPIGKLLDELDICTKRIIKDISVVNSNRCDFELISNNLSVDAKDVFFERTYSVLCSGQILMTINEVFNARRFTR